MASRERLVRANLRLVVAISINYKGRGLAFSELVEAGAAGLMRAVDYFDPAQGTRFSTCASWWVKQSIRQAYLTANRFDRPPGSAA